MYYSTLSDMLVIDKDCYGTIAVAWAICLVLLALDLCFIPWKWLSIPLAVFIVVFMFFVMWFHRIPKRKTAGSDTVVTAVADGKIVIVEKAFEPEFIKKECMKVSIYMNFFDVHANFWPVDGEVKYFKYHEGKYLMAFYPKSSELNEHSSVAVGNSHGDILFKQIAGTFARRIVTHAEPGQKCKAGEQFGIIKFGSRIDMYLPVDAEIKVKPGDLTVACETVIATLR